MPEHRSPETASAKQQDLDGARVQYPGTTLTTNTGTRPSDTDNSLRAGERGPTLLEDFHAREKITHFDHERISERVVHARGSAAHGRFRPYDDSLFIQDAVKFPDFVHSVKPEPHNEIPQAQSAHDTFWDFVALQPEAMHTVMWLMSDHALPRSFRMMNGFGVHTFRLANDAGRSTFVKFHWRPMLGAHSLVAGALRSALAAHRDFSRAAL